jgi:hypothetical protein
MEFQAFPKIPRFRRNVVITEKIDGTNAQVGIGELSYDNLSASIWADPTILATYTDDAQDRLLIVRAGSRKRWLTLDQDNFGFARYVKDNAAALAQLGPGRHFGEWWGKGIQRGYGLDEKRFSLFSAARWGSEPNLPLCCNVVPLLYAGPFDIGIIEEQLDWLRVDGSQAEPGYQRPEGVVIYHTHSKTLFKMTLDGDDEAKGS